MSMYEKFLAGELLQVQFIGQPEWGHKGPFTIQRLLIIGNPDGGPAYWVGEDEVWAKWAQVGGVIINRRRRERMSDADLREWCAGLEEVAHEPATN